jgi:hypothetical protein
MRSNFSFFRARWEAIIIYWFSFFIIFMIEFFLPENIPHWHHENLIYHVFLVLILTFFLSFFIELFFYLSKIISALVLRLRSLWKYFIPSILIFFLFIFPLFDLTELKFAINHLEGLKGNIYIVIFGIIILTSFVLIIIFPLFYGLNGGFIIISCILSYVINKVLLYKYFPNYPIWKFLLFYYLFIYLFYFFLQLRRRWGLILYYEHYYYPKWFIFSFVILWVILSFFKFQLNEYFVYYLIFSLNLSFCLINFILSILINFEENLKKRIFSIPYFVFFILFFGNLILTIILYYNFDKYLKRSLVKNSKNLSSIYLIETLHFLTDLDKDGENFLFGNDPDDSLLNIKSEGKYIFKEEQTKNLILNNSNNFDYYLVTLFLKEKIYNPQLDRISPSNITSVTLFSLLNNISSYEVYLYKNQSLKKNLKSIFSIMTQNYYRTICIGYDAENNYYQVKTSLRIDNGCEIFLPYVSKDINNNKIEHFKNFMDFAKKQYKNYSVNKNMLWLHYDFSNITFIDKEMILAVLNQEIPFHSQLIKNDYKYIYLIFYIEPIPHFEVLSNIENLESILNIKFSNYGIIYRIIFYNELLNYLKIDDKIWEHPFFLDEYTYSLSKNLNHYNFLEPDDSYWLELIKLFHKPIIPPISVIEENNKTIKIYDGRFGIKYNYP